MVHGRVRLGASVQQLEQIEGCHDASDLVGVDDEAVRHGPRRHEGLDVDGVGDGREVPGFHRLLERLEERRIRLGGVRVVGPRTPREQMYGSMNSFSTSKEEALLL